MGRPDGCRGHPPFSYENSYSIVGMDHSLLQEPATVSDSTKVCGKPGVVAVEGILSINSIASGTEIAIESSMPRKNRVVSRRDGVREGLGGLTPQEAEFIRMRFGAGGRKAHTLKEVGQKFSVTEEQIQQVEAKALRKLRKAGSPAFTWARND
jgi:hypothetical protein